MARKMLERPDRLRANITARPTGVDRTAKVIRGVVVAQAGPFKSDGRGEFDDLSLQQIVGLWPKNGPGLKSRFSHPNESSDGLGKYLGRVRAPYLGKALVDRGGQQVEVSAVRGDLYLDPSAFKTPNGDLGTYLLDLAESDPSALSTSLVLSSKQEHRLNPDGTPMLDANGEHLPPLWRPTRLWASDVVDEGDAVDGILSATVGPPRYTREYLERGEEIIDSLFANQPRRVVRARLLSYLNRYLNRRYGDEPMSKKNCKNCNCNDQLGATLGGVLDDYIEAGASDERPREVIIGQMAEAAGIPVEGVSAIVQGSDNCPPAEVLQAFSQVLGCQLGELIGAAEADGCDYSAPAETPVDPAAEPAPAPAAAMRAGSKLENWRRKFDRKAGGF